MCSIIGNSSGNGGDVFPGQNDHYHDGVNKEEDRNCSELVVGNDGTLRYLPLWDDIHSNVRWVFLLHHYGFACLFFFLAFYAFFSILNLRSQLSTRSYMSTINSFLCLLGVSRALNLLLLQAHIKLPVLIGALLNDLAFPCLISSFSLIQIAFLQLTQQAVPQHKHKLCQMSPDSSVFVISQWKYDSPHMLTGEVNIKFRKKTCLSIIITIHFVTVFVSAIYTSFNADLMQVKLVTQLVFALWGLILCGSFLYAGKQVLGILGPSGHSTEGSSVTSGNDKGNMKGLVGMGMGLLAPGQNIAASLTAALAPTLLHSTPKIKITDENDRTVSVTSDLSRLNDNVDGGNNSTTSGSSNRPVTPVPGPSTSKSILNNFTGDNPGDSSSSSNYVRPPSPVLPRRKSGGSSRTVPCGIPTASLSTSQTRRQSLNRRGSGYVDEKDANRKKSLTWSESEVKESGSKQGKGGKQKNLGDNNVTGELGGSRRQSRKSMDNNADGNLSGNDKNGAADSLLLSGSGAGPDLTLQSILSHIAYVNQTALDYRLSRKLSRKNQVQKVIKFTSITAVLGALLCIGEIIRILSPYGLLASTSPPHLWPWFAMQTISRTIEFAMGATVANITKQPGPTRQNLRFYY